MVVYSCEMAGQLQTWDWVIAGEKKESGLEVWMICRRCKAMDRFGLATVFGALTVGVFIG
jgi:hypothetical protein